MEEREAEALLEVLGESLTWGREEKKGSGEGLWVYGTCGAVTYLVFQSALGEAGEWSAVRLGTPGGASVARYGSIATAQEACLRHLRTGRWHV